MKTLKDRNSDLIQSTRELKNEQLQLEFDKFDKSLDPVNNKLALLNDRLSMLSDNNYNAKIETIGDIMDENSKKIESMKDEFYRLAQNRLY